MKVVINIPEDMYKRYIALHMNGLGGKAEGYIANGIPLPKNHGRLGDLSKVYVELNEAQIEGTEEYKGLGEAKQIVCEAPTIIEAESEE